MFRRLLSHLQGELLTHVVTNFRIVLSVHKNVLPYDGVTRAETCSIFDDDNNNSTCILLYMCICWCIKDIMTVETKFTIYLFCIIYCQLQYRYFAVSFTVIALFST